MPPAPPLASRQLFEASFARLLEFEGDAAVYNARVGLTKYGVTEKFHLGVDIRLLTESQAKEIYRKEYWERLGVASLPARLQTPFLLAAVNCGGRRATMALQRALRAAGEKKLEDDGIIGEKTWAALLRASSAPREGEVLAAFREGIAEHYRRLAAERPEMRIYLTGLLRRAYEG